VASTVGGRRGEKEIPGQTHPPVVREREGGEEKRPAVLVLYGKKRKKKGGEGLISPFQGENSREEKEEGVLSA